MIGPPCRPAQRQRAHQPQLGTATSAIQYLLIASSSGLQQAVDQVNQDYINLGNLLSGS
jgi:hypothetical protein